ncbi:MAG: flagellar basal body P-ring protein FlgI, partial [Candidatus Margulisiibacteriota bacterium]
IKNTDTVSQPNPLSGGTTTLVKGSVIEVEPSSTETNHTFNLLHANNTIEDLVAVLNNIGVTPSDTIAILQLMKEAGAIKAKLEII